MCVARQVRLGNPKIQSVLGEVPGAIDAMVALGWALEDAEGEQFLVVPAGKFLGMQQVSKPCLNEDQNAAVHCAMVDLRR